jgi:hypothetical protein
MLKSSAISHFGSQAKLARAVERAESTVSEWPEVLPLGIAVIAEKVSRGKVRVDWALYPKVPEALRPQ